MKKALKIQGIIKRHPDGFGFLIPDDRDQPDVFLSRKNMQNRMNKDKVIVHAFNKEKDDRYFGEVLEVLEHGIKRVVGEYKKQNNGDGLILDHNGQWGSNITVPFKMSRGAINGDAVVAEITHYPDDKEGLKARVIEILGDMEDALNDHKRVLHLQEVPMGFSPGVKHEVDAIPDTVDPKDYTERKDLTQKPLITIDGKTAKDFDDAICVEATNSGFKVYVAIADVSHYVKKKTDLDEAAYERGTSVYLPSFVEPMLPEKLSNGLCSLKPREYRLSFVCEAHLDFQGELLSYDFYEAVIYSHARVTYGEAQDIVSEETKHELPAVQQNITVASQLAKILMNKRFKEGALDLDVPESYVVLDAAGEPIEIVRSDRLFAHRLIEELMLLANVCVAKAFTRSEKPNLYRIHESPEDDNIETLQQFIDQYGSKKKLRGGHLQKKMTKSLRDFAGSPEGMVLSILTLRSMKQARYSPDNVGHFGLGFEDYTHFTSPIRRYPDLIIHRQLKALKGINGYALDSLENLTTQSHHLSACEQRAVKTERMVVSIKKARFMRNHLGETLEGVISSVVKFGFFVLIKDFDIDGLVKKDDISDDLFEYDEKNLILKGKKTGLTFKMGDTVRVVVSAVDTNEGKIDFILEGSKNAKNNKPIKKNKSDYKKRKSSKRHTKDSSKARVPRRTKKKSSR